MKALNISGQVFGRLTVISRVENDHRNRTQWKCRCDCGSFTVVSTEHIASGHTKSCGCLRRDLITAVAKNNIIHGDMCGGNATPEYGAWHNLKSRCLNPDNKVFAYYGGRGIEVCDRWLGKEGYANFLEDMGRRPPNGKWSIDRIDNNGNYSPENCWWATPLQQIHNRRSRSTIVSRGVCPSGHLVTEATVYQSAGEPARCRECRRLREAAKRLAVPHG